MRKSEDQPRRSNIHLIRDQEIENKWHQCKTSRMMAKDVLEKEKRDRKEHYQRNNTRKFPRIAGHELIDWKEIPHLNEKKTLN